MDNELKQYLKKMEERIIAQNKKDLDNLFKSIVRFFETHGIGLLK